ncbi:hypothetical protein A9R05_41890 (plasmid) [Burkholderia sp. KK1]|uniref:hypothetical protein n=1 Tax=Burkholderia TaxID=32008 RepID=UPI000979C179|nr:MULTISPECIES: hypothetical protein [Burkholderia]AQH05578.1 hypothetical protein A9R05_41890 [Burkholderia sp. KK1]
MIVEQTRQLGDSTRLARHVALGFMALMLAGVALLAFSPNAHLRLVGALSLGIGIGVQVGAKLAVWKA